MERTLSALAILFAGACVYDWADYDPRVTDGSGGAAAVGGAGGVSSMGGQGGDGDVGGSSGGMGGDGGAPLPGPVELFVDDMESGEGDWTHEKVSGAMTENDAWSLSGPEVNGGASAWYSGPTTADALNARLVSPIIDLSRVPMLSTVTLTFWHWHDFDDCDDPDRKLDGAFVGVSTDDGGSYARVDPEGGYDGTFMDMCSGPLNTGDGFFNDTGGAFEEERIDLTAYVGSSIRIGFEVAYDCGNCDATSLGWFIDDVSVIATP